MTQMKKEGAYVIPALPGYNLVSLIHPSDEMNYYDAHQEPILAWLVVHETGVRVSGRFKEPFDFIEVKPISVEGLDDDSAIMSPDGKVTVPFDCTYPSVENWLEAASEAEREKKRKSSSSPSSPSSPAPVLVMQGDDSADDKEDG